MHIARQAPPHRFTCQGTCHINCKGFDTFSKVLQMKVSLRVLNSSSQPTQTRLVDTSHTLRGRCLVARQTARSTHISINSHCVCVRVQSFDLDLDCGSRYVHFTTTGPAARSGFACVHFESYRGRNCRPVPAKSATIQSVLMHCPPPVCARHGGRVQSSQTED